MCGRYSLYGPISLSREAKQAAGQLHLDLIGALSQREPQFQVAPTQRAPVAFQGDSSGEIQAFKWGLMPSWAKDIRDAAKRINARVETVIQKPSYRAAFKHRRCLVPMSAYFEWKGDKPPKQPYLIHDPSGALLMSAGLWEVWKDPSDPAADWLRTFTVVVGPPGQISGDIHNRQPVFLPPDRWVAWLRGTPEDAEQVITNLPAAGLTYFPVSKRLNNPRNQGPELIEEVVL